MDYVFTCTDYGRAWRATDAEVVADVLDNSGSHQACKVAQDNGTLCDHVAIIVKPGGYAVKAVFAPVPVGC